MWALRPSCVPFWTRVKHPNIEGLHPTVAAEVLLCVEFSTGWIGGRDNILKQMSGPATCSPRVSLTMSRSRTRSGSQPCAPTRLLLLARGCFG